MEPLPSESQTKFSYQPVSFVAYLKHLEKFNRQIALMQSDGELEISYKDLICLVKSKAAWIQSFADPGDRIIFDDLNGPTWVVHFLACMVASVIAVPLDKRMSKDLKAQIVKDVNPVMVFGNARYKNIKTIEPDLEVMSTPINLKKIKISNQSLACILYTSGTWGNPKGVMLSHQNLLHNLYAVTNDYLPHQGEVFLSVLPLAHAYELMVGMLIPLFSGSTIVYQNKLDSYALKQSLQKYRVTTMVAVPKLLEIIHQSIIRKAKQENKYSVLQFMLSIAQHLPFSARRWLFQDIHYALGRNLQTLVIGGAPLKHPEQQFFQRIGYKVLIGYGLTETSPVLTVCLDQHKVSGCVGKPIKDLEMKIVEEEVVVRGPNIFQGYWPQSSSSNRWFKTGDLGKVDHKGNLILQGRRKNTLVFSTGDKLDLEFIEQLAEQIPGVTEAGAANIGTTVKPTIALLVVTNKSPNYIRHHLNQQLPKIGQIKKVIISANELQRTHTKKLNRVVLTKLLKSSLHKEI